MYVSLPWLQNPSLKLLDQWLKGISKPFSKFLNHDQQRKMSSSINLLPLKLSFEKMIPSYAAIYSRLKLSTRSAISETWLQKASQNHVGGNDASEFAEKHPICLTKTPIPTKPEEFCCSWKINELHPLHCFWRMDRKSHWFRYFSCANLILFAACPWLISKQKRMFCLESLHSTLIENSILIFISLG